jgi:Yeast cell wall synthesis protein KRE9/KNH1
MFVLALLITCISFLRMQSTIHQGGRVINYSPHFYIAHEAVVSPTETQSKANTHDLRLKGLPRELELPSTNIKAELRKRDGDPFTVPLSLQFGPTIYAPMQSYPPTKITKMSPTPQYPRSSFVLASTPLLPNKNIQTTMTQGITWAFSQIENQVGVINESQIQANRQQEPAQSMPTDDMVRFLGRWRD